jgi:hypothetical protein
MRLVSSFCIFEQGVAKAGISKGKNAGGLPACQREFRSKVVHKTINQLVSNKIYPMPHDRSLLVKIQRVAFLRDSPCSDLPCSDLPCSDQ